MSQADNDEVLHSKEQHLVVSLKHILQYIEFSYGVLTFGNFIGSLRPVTTISIKKRPLNLAQAP